MKETTIALVAVLVCANGSMRAADYELPDTSVVYNLKEVEVSGTRATVKMPIAFTMVSADELSDNNNGLDVPYLLQFTPSVITTSDAGAGMGYTSIRVRGTDGSRINVTANGVPVNNPESHVVYWVNTPDLVSSLKDIQVQRGVGTSTNGAGAFGASINMETTALSSMPYGEVSGAYGMYNTHKETVKIGTGLMNDHWTLDARLSNLGSDGYIDRAWSKLWSYFGQLGYYNGGTALKFIAFGGKEQTYMAWDYASKEDMEKYGRRYNPCGQYTDAEGNVAYYPNQIDNYVQHNFQLLLNQSLAKGMNLSAALFYVKGNGYYEQYKTGRNLVEYGLRPFEVDGEEVTKSDLVRYKKMDNWFAGGIFAVSYKNDVVDASVGGGLNKYDGDHFGQVGWVRNYIGQLDPMQEYYRNKGRKTDANIYARANVDICCGLSGYADLQYRHIYYRINGVSDTYDWSTGAMQRLAINRKYDFFNPKIGLNYKADDRNRIYASWSVAHREPTRDNFIDCAPDRQPVAERLFDYELGYEHHGRIFSAGVNLYYMDYKNQLVPTGRLSDTGNPVSENMPRSYRMGVEIVGKLKPCDFFQWQLTATWSRNRVKNFTEYIYEDEWTNPITIGRGDTPLAFSPDFTLNNIFAFNYRGFDASLNSHLVSRQYLTNSGNREQTIDPYFVTDLHLGYDFGRVAALKDLRVGCTVYNIFSEKYENNGYAGAGYYMDGTEKVIYRYAGYAAQAPIHVMANITVRF